MKSQQLNQKGKFVFELKQRILQSLNKLSDRDTYQLGSYELQQVAETLTPDTIAPFLFCVADTGAEAKSSVRRECVRLIGVLATSHGGVLAPHMARIVPSVVKRLKDSDSVVREACVETCGVLARNVEGVFVALARPLFEAMGEQNRYMQGGGALCLARVIDESVDLPGEILPQMLSRVVKLMKNQHFMAKPALIDLIRSIIQAGGASTESSLSTALTSILDCLKCRDWTTRKAAASALSSIALSGDNYMLGSFASSCLRSLEGCRFDKVKPVRDAISYAIQCWKSLSVDSSLELSEATSSLKENFCSEYPEVTSISDNGSRSTSIRKPISNSDASPNTVPFPKGSKTSASSTKKRTPLSLRKSNNTIPKPKPLAWEIEVSVPKKKPISSLPIIQKDVKECVKEEEYSDLGSGSCLTKDVVEGAECDSNINFNNSDRFSVKFFNEGDAEIEVESESAHDLIHDKNIKKGSDVSACGSHRCCVNAKNELGFIRKQLEEIESKQNSLFDILKEFMGCSMDNFTTLHSKIYKMENTTDHMVNLMSQEEPNFGNGNPNLRLSKTGNTSVSMSPRVSYSSPRSSTETNYRNPQHFPTITTKLFPENPRYNNEIKCTRNDPGRMQTNGFPKWFNGFSGTGDVSTKSEKSVATKCAQSDSEINTSENHGKQFINGYLGTENHTLPLDNDNFNKQINEFIADGDVESAYIAILCSGDDMNMIQLMELTGPVFHKLSSETASEVLRVISIRPMDRKFLAFAMPWIQQVVDLSTAQDSRQLFLSPRTQRELLHSLQQAVNTPTVDSTTRVAVAQLAARLGKAFGLVPTRKLQPREARATKNFISVGT